MAFDIFVGSFTRYIGGDWENLGQRAAREQGIPYKIIRDSETEEAPPPTEEIAATVAEWREALNQGLKDQLKTPLTWEESMGTAYVTDRPDWAGYASLLLWAAYEDAPKLKKPKTLASLVQAFDELGVAQVSRVKSQVREWCCAIQRLP